MEVGNALSEVGWEVDTGDMSCRSTLRSGHMPSLASMDADKIYRFDVEGQEVVCYQTGADRLWVCKCDHFQRTLTQQKQGFCPHTAVAIMRAMQDGTIDFNF